MNAVERYVRAKAALAEAQAWANLFGPPTNAKAVDMVFYFSAKKGNNISPMPTTLRRACEENALSKITQIVNQSLNALQAELEAIALEAKAEYAQIAADAGITVP